MTSAAASAILARHADGAPEVGIVLGSGLGDVESLIAEPMRISYADIPGFPRPSVAGHTGHLVLGRVSGSRVAMLAGRAHFYEHGRADAMKGPISVLAEIGCKVLVLTNAAGSLRAEHGPGSVVAISDHINLVGQSPLFGETGSARFVDMTNAYDRDLRAALREAARQSAVALGEGVYMWFAGPQFETPAEIRAADRLGADLVGMSTVPEAILARHAGLKVAALSIVTNMAAGLASQTLSHAQTLEAATKAAASVKRLLGQFLADRVWAS